MALVINLILDYIQEIEDRNERAREDALHAEYVSDMFRQISHID